MTTSATPRNCNAPFRSFKRETVAKSLIGSLLLAGLVAFAFTIGQFVQESRATPSVAKAERSGVLLALTPVF